VNARPDVYYGDVAENYQPSREVKAKWKAEQAAVTRFLTEGPVLDVPFGTGRFVPLYREKGLTFKGVDISPDMLSIARRKFPDVNASLGSAFDLRFAEGAFQTVVCVRFLEWLPITTAKVLLDRLRRIAPNLILTITHGIEGQPEAYTYDYGKFLKAIDGLLIEDRQVTAQVRDMTSEAFKLRPANWADVVAQFQYDCGSEAEGHIQRIADKHAGFFGLPSVPVHSGCAVRAEYWSNETIGVCVDALSEHRFITNTPPRRNDMPLTVIDRDGVALIIDGRKRANVWMKEKGPHPVLVVTP
jgi:SAM-dependent methyltransferase